MSIIIRPVKYLDRFWVLKLMNEKTVRLNSFNTKPILEKANDTYWKRKLGKEGFEAFVIELKEKPVGLIRIENKEVSIAITKECRRKGIATLALSKCNLKNCFVEIKPNNISSITLFKKLGFKKIKHFKNKIILQKKEAKK